MQCDSANTESWIKIATWDVCHTLQLSALVIKTNKKLKRLFPSCSWQSRRGLFRNLNVCDIDIVSFLFLNMFLLACNMTSEMKSWFKDVSTTSVVLLCWLIMSDAILHVYLTVQHREVENCMEGRVFGKAWVPWSISSMHCNGLLWRHHVLDNLNPST